MNAQQLFEEIKEINLTYMNLVRQLMKVDRVAASESLGMSEELTDVVCGMDAGQMLRISSNNMMLCNLHFDEQLLLSLVGDRRSQRLSLDKVEDQQLEAVAA